MKYTRYCPSTINRETHPHLSAVSKCWQTEDGKYDILFDEVCGFKHLRIRRIDNQTIHNFMDMQEIKNDLWGEDVVAVEVYPKQNDFKNGSNTYHLWTWNDITVPNLAQLYKYKTEDAPQDIEECRHGSLVNAVQEASQRFAYDQGDFRSFPFTFQQAEHFIVCLQANGLSIYEKNGARITTGSN